MSCIYVEGKSDVPKQVCPFTSRSNSRCEYYKDKYKVALRGYRKPNGWVEII